MSTRENILKALQSNLVQNDILPELVEPAIPGVSPKERLRNVLEGIGGKLVEAGSWDDIIANLKERFAAPSRWVSAIPSLSTKVDSSIGNDPHLLHNVNLAILKGHFAVAENGAVWITSELMGDRALPFICEHLALVIDEENIVDSMFDAYERLALLKYDFGSFIAGPSKTADIEQSLVLGAHGPKSMTLFVLHS